MDPALLRNIALQTNDQGAADAQLALAARRLIDKQGDVQIDPDDLPGTFQRLGGAAQSTAVPMWVKYAVSLAAIKAAPLFSGLARVTLFETAGITVIHDAMIMPAARFLGVGGAPVEVNVLVGHDGQLESIVPTQSGYGDDPFDPLGSLQSTPMGVTPSYQRAFFHTPTEVNLYVELVMDPPAELADIDALTAGAVDLWLLKSVLP